MSLTKISFLGLLMSFQWGWAGELFEYGRPLRSLGMGGAYIAIPNPEDAPLVNPAALAWVDEISWEIVNVGVGVNGLEIANTAKNLQGIDSAADFDAFYGKRVWGKAFGRSSMVIPYFGLAAFGELTFDMNLKNPAYPSLDLGFMNDLGINVSGAIPFGPMTALGITAKRITRQGGRKSIGLGVISEGSGQAILDQFQDYGLGYGLDLALMAKLPIPLSPSFALVWKDAGDTSFNKTKGTAAPTKIQNNLAFGTGASLDLPGLDLSAAFEVRNLMQKNTSLGQKLHFGTEISIPFFDIRAGVSQGYPTYGLGFSFLFLDVEAAYYFTELGAYPGQTPQNRIQASISFQLSVDANFSFKDKDGKKRKLKQRR